MYCIPTLFSNYRMHSPDSVLRGGKTVCSMSFWSIKLIIKFGRIKYFNKNLHEQGSKGGAGYPLAMNSRQRVLQQFAHSITHWTKSFILHTQCVFPAMLSPATVCMQPLAHLLNHMAQHLQVQHLKCREWGLISQACLPVAQLWLSTILNIMLA